MTYITLPFGWKASLFVYQSICICATSYLRSLNVIKTHDLYHRFAVTKAGKLQVDDESLIEGRELAYILLELLRRLRYTLSLKKCLLVPSSCKKFLGF